MTDQNIPLGIPDPGDDHAICPKCGYDGVNIDGEQEHWATCPYLKDEDDYQEVE